MGHTGAKSPGSVELIPWWIRIHHPTLVNLISPSPKTTQINQTLIKLSRGTLAQRAQEVCHSSPKYEIDFTIPQTIQIHLPLVRFSWGTLAQRTQVVRNSSCGEFAFTTPPIWIWFNFPPRQYLTLIRLAWAKKCEDPGQCAPYPVVTLNSPSPHGESDFTIPQDISN